MADSKDIATVERFIPAPAGKIFDLLADPARHRDIDGSGTVRDATTGSQRLTLGATFGMSMKAGISYKMASTIIEFEEDRLIAWQTKPTANWMGWFAGGRIWRYELEPVDGGTLVKESWDISQERGSWKVRPLRKRTIEGMTKTLERIEEIVTVK